MHDGDLDEMRELRRLAVMEEAELRRKIFRKDLLTAFPWFVIGVLLAFIFIGRAS